MRDNQSYDLYDELGMFHVPFEKRTLTSNQRYSISGYPSLYLGSSVYGCWEELRRPNIDLCNVSVLRNVEPLLIINLSIADLPTDKLVEHDIYNIAMSLICSLTVSNYKAPFKPEYIIPQNLLSCVIRQNDKLSNAYYDGIKYTSSLYGSSRRMFQSLELFDEYVFPIKISKRQGYCNELARLFAISHPTTMAINRLKYPATYMTQCRGASVYDVSEFGRLEETLLGSRTELVETIIRNKCR